MRRCAPRDPGNPYADDDGARLLEFLRGYQLTRAPGERYEYSNLGVGLLGYALDGAALRARFTGQEALRIYPTAEGRCFYKVVDAQLEFELPAGDAAPLPSRCPSSTRTWRSPR